MQNLADMYKILRNWKRWRDELQISSFESQKKKKKLRNNDLNDLQMVYQMI